MDSYIKSKGFQAIGPIIQQSITSEEGATIRFCRQANGFINNIEFPYSIVSTLRVPKCLYLRYVGTLDKMHIAYQKLNVVAYEEDIDLKSETYTIFVKEDSDSAVVDVFAPQI